MGAMTEPPLGVPEMRPLLDALAGLDRDSQGIIEHDLYPCPPDLPLPDRQAHPDLPGLLQLGTDRHGEPLVMRPDLSARPPHRRPRGRPDGRLPRGRADPAGARRRGWSVVNDFLADKAAAVAESVGARAVADPIAAIHDPEVDAVLIASPGAAHEAQVNACLDAGVPCSARSR